jgi:hypothetical protein
MIVSEALQSADFTGDGDMLDAACFIYDLADGSLTDTGKGLDFGSFPNSSAHLREEVGSYAVYYGLEIDSATDWTGDGDLNDRVVFLLDGDDETEINTGLAIQGVTGNPWTTHVKTGGQCLLISVFEASMIQDLNGDGDLSDSVYHLVELP